MGNTGVGSAGETHDAGTFAPKARIVLSGAVRWDHIDRLDLPVLWHAGRGFGLPNRHGRHS